MEGMAVSKQAGLFDASTVIAADPKLDTGGADLRLSIVGEIQPGSFREIQDQLEAHPKAKTTHVSLHSPGGSVFEGFAIYAALDRHPSEISVEIAGLAASIASVIAMAASPGKIRMHQLGRIMIHQSRGPAFGTWSDMEQMKALLRDLDGASVEAYGRHASMTAAGIEAAMDATTWYGAKEALAAGLISEVVQGPDVTNRLDLRTLADVEVPEGVRQLFDRTRPAPCNETTTSSVYSEVLLHIQRGAPAVLPIAPSYGLMGEVREALAWLKETA